MLNEAVTPNNPKTAGKSPTKQPGHAPPKTPTKTPNEVTPPSLPFIIDFEPDSLNLKIERLIVKATRKGVIKKLKSKNGIKNHKAKLFRILKLTYNLLIKRFRPT